MTEQQVRELVRAQQGNHSRISAGYIIEGSLDIALLRKSIAEVMRRHGALRTAVISNDQADVQLVMRHVEPPLYVLSGEPTELSVAGVRRFVEARLGKNLIRLNHAPMWYVSVVKLSPERHAIIGICSRMMFDFNSVAIMFRSVLTAYESRGALLGSARPAQYREFSLAQDTWRRRDLAAWIDTWLGRVDFGKKVSSRGDFPLRAQQPEQLMSDMFEISRSDMNTCRALAHRRGCDVLLILIAALALTDRIETDALEHRFAMAQHGRKADEDRAIGAYQLNGLLAFDLEEGDGLNESLNKVLSAREFMIENRGIGLESLLEGLLPRMGGALPIPFRISVHFGEPAAPIELSQGSSISIDYMQNLQDRIAPLDQHTEGSVMFVQGDEVDVVLVSWWDSVSNAPFYAGLWEKFPAHFGRLLTEEANLCASGRD